MKVLYCRRPGRLLWVIHHLAVDGVSWRILLEDFQRAYAGQALPARTASFQQWARRLEGYASSDEVSDQLHYWLRAHRATPLPVDFPGGENTEASARSITVSLPEEDTRTLLREAPAAFGAPMEALLLTALAGAFRQETGNPALLVNLEGHGREDSWSDLDVSRTVGWFTTMFPVRLEAETADPLETLRAVNGELRRMPNRGFGYGLLRYLRGAESARRFRSLPQPEVSFNYLGQFTQEPSQAPLLRPAGGPNGPMRSPLQRRAHRIDVTGGVAGGRLRVEWIYSRDLHQAETIRRTAEAFVTCLRDLAAAARSGISAGAGEPAEADSGLGAADLDVVLDGLE
ncbi:MAG: hypothetical protein IT158_04985 [Bryobacterales bacterium]|nr:hypothetical protein [Bryobacterales bacterium]